ncbi:tRNA-dihydrouridine synthase 1 [Purpureocillium lilacinum]|uniref:tRNA-dihydrouridine(16/17) synthase [NAD(P)(+)] n=1 Tax=Purpureocillium lilacinum TaxID=33203 RepID=A0A179HI46_PURLI|nr:tRNA-dihydrouridine synthase 1 [Purpureocillium lilacinum]OAQ89298.1 tRNA-dihydrouridine synthase 1 [Purpureocillium lilacinum]
MTATEAQEAAKPGKLHGRAFYESIGSPKYIVAPMVDQSEFAWRMLTRSYMPESEQSKLLAYTPMLHARLFSQEEKYRRGHFQAVRPDASEPWLDGNPSMDRPLFVQFCANDPDALLAAARHVAPYCDAVDLNLGCPQGIARKGHYGAFLQEDQDLIFRLINKLHKELSIPVTAKIRILETREKTLAYAQNVLKAGASILTVHGRRREQKGHLTGLADWETLKWLRDSLPPETVMFANGNILQEGDVEKCLEATGVDGIMSAEGNLSDPAIFAKPPPVGEEGREYWRGKDGRGGWRVDGMTRRYLDIIHKYALGEEPPKRRPLFMPGDDTAWLTADAEREGGDGDEPARKRRKKDGPPRKEEANPNLSAMQPHLFHLLRHFVTRHTDVRDMLARSRKDGIDGYERVLDAVERRVAEGLLEYERTGGESFEAELRALDDPPPTAAVVGSNGGGAGEVQGSGAAAAAVPEAESSRGTIRRCKRPWWVAQPIVRPLPSEALAKGAITLSKKNKAAGVKEPGPQNGNGKAASQKAEAEAAAHGNGDAAQQAEAEGKKEEIALRDELVAG